MSFEKQEIQNLPAKYQPLSCWTYFLLTLLYSIPVVGLVFLILHAISAGNINKRNFARSYFCVFVIAFVVLLISVLSGAIGEFLQNFATV